MYVRMCICVYKYANACMQQVIYAPSPRKVCVTLIAVLTIIGAHEAEFYSGQDDKKLSRPK